MRLWGESRICSAPARMRGGSRLRVADEPAHDALPRRSTWLQVADDPGGIVCIAVGRPVHDARPSCPDWFIADVFLHPASASSGAFTCAVEVGHVGPQDLFRVFLHEFDDG